MPEKCVYLSLGSNIGDRQQNLERAIASLDKEATRVVARSSIYETEPQDLRDQPWFLNLVVQCVTRYFPLQLLAFTQRIERELGRRRGATVRRGPRPIDIDILLYGSVVMETSQLTIPHPRMFERRFVLEPLVEIAPQLRHPVTKQPIQELLKQVVTQAVRLF
jgi:2-amino-4-hydroxy-6-hydroxymethyldihydropteridine diphosphokinase